jgi:predicted Zn-dependent protease
VDSSSSHGDGTVELAPTDDNPLALQYSLWTATDTAYKNALRAYSAKQAALKQYQSAQAQPDFAQVKPVVQVFPLVTLDLDRKEWKQRIVEASGLYASDPEVRSFAQYVQYSTASVRAIALNRYLVNTEGTMVRQGYTGYNGGISVGGQAADGMRLSRDNGTVATTAKELESASSFRKRVIEDLKSFDELRNAPVVSADDYHGPVLFSGDAVADVFNRLFVPNVEADRPEMVRPPTTGTYPCHKSCVLPDLMSVTDDPLQTKFNGKGLLGAYVIDDEGFRRIGRHRRQASSKLPHRPRTAKVFASSNGHGRAAPPRPRPSSASSSQDVASSKDDLNARPAGRKCCRRPQVVTRR